MIIEWMYMPLTAFLFIFYLENVWTLRQKNDFVYWIWLIGLIGDEIAPSEGLAVDKFGTCQQQFKRLILFSGNDYLSLSSHPAVRKAAAKVCFMIDLSFYDLIFCHICWLNIFLLINSFHNRQPKIMEWAQGALL